MKGACAFQRIASLLLTAGFAVMACRVDVPLGALEGGSLDGETIEGGSDSAGAFDAAKDSLSDAPDNFSDGGCGVDFAQLGDWKALQVVQQSTPQGTGGTIQPGTYRLTAFTAYLGGGLGTAEVRETLVVKGSPTVGTFERLSEIRASSGQFTDHPPRGETYTWRAQGSAFLFATPTCSPLNQTEWATTQYSASGSSITLTAQGRGYSYERVP